MQFRQFCQIRLQRAVKSRQPWKWVETTDALARDRPEQKDLRRLSSPIAPFHGRYVRRYAGGRPRRLRQLRSRVASHRMPHFNQLMPDNSETIAQRVTVIGGQRHADDYQVIWRDLPIGRIMRASGGPMRFVATYSGR
jgi:hypothetical protein